MSTNNTGRDLWLFELHTVFSVTTMYTEHRTLPPSLPFILFSSSLLSVTIYWEFTMRQALKRDTEVKQYVSGDCWSLKSKTASANLSREKSCGNKPCRPAWVARWSKLIGMGGRGKCLTLCSMLIHHSYPHTVIIMEQSTENIKQHIINVYIFVPWEYYITLWHLVC